MRPRDISRYWRGPPPAIKPGEAGKPYKGRTKGGGASRFRGDKFLENEGPDYRP